MDGWIGQVMLQRTDESQLYPVICTGVHGKSRTLICQDFRKGRIVKAMASEVAETVGPWSGPVQELEEKLPELVKFSKPTLLTLDWTGLEAGRGYDLEEMCSVVGATEMEQRLAVALALLALPEEQVSRVRREDGFELPLYTPDREALEALQELRLPIQGLRPIRQPRSTKLASFSNRTPDLRAAAPKERIRIGPRLSSTSIFPMR
ncbi:hypothetical protein [Cohnella zeiphila]|uniref:Uncharacterized protein n=1 Tax=Cohnella zeiphila TaxID=2761120 RepID=A0A7X0SQV4_9BACL|nr:hypothetical protein [Cohnella zeiphila]MBB6732228.1 hypothetical protein [Cohnella zeiphila]